MRLSEEIKEVRSRIRFLGMPIDLLTGERYAVGPPSIVNGKPYELRKGKGWVAIDALPTFPSHLLEEHEKQETPNVNKPVLNVSGIVNRTRGPVTRLVRNPEAYVLHVVSHEGNNGSAGLVRAVCVFRDAGKTAQETFDYLTKVWNQPPRVVPPWSDKEIAHCVRRHFH